MSANAVTSSLQVTASAGCPWTASSNASWLTITAGGSGTGNGQVTFSITVNSSTTSRVGIMSIAQQTVTVTQSGASNPAPTPTQREVVGNYTLELQVASRCNWPVTTHRWPVIAESDGSPIGGYYTGSVDLATNGGFFWFLEYSYSEGFSHLSIYMGSSTISSTGGYSVNMLGSAEGPAPTVATGSRPEILNMSLKGVSTLYGPGSPRTCGDYSETVEVGRLSLRVR